SRARPVPSPSTLGRAHALLHAGNQLVRRLPCAAPRRVPFSVRRPSGAVPFIESDNAMMRTTRWPSASTAWTFTHPCGHYPLTGREVVQVTPLASQWLILAQSRLLRCNREFDYPGKWHDSPLCRGCLERIGIEHCLNAVPERFVFSSSVR